MQQQPSASPRRNERHSLRRSIIYILSGFCGALIIGTFIALFIIYFRRYRNTVASLLSYPNFVCHQRPCGCPNAVESLISRIVGGKDASPYIYPWLVGLTERQRTEPFCAGFIITSNVILTAAHCLTRRSAKQTQILSKLHDIRDFQGHRHDIENWIVHPDYQINDTMHLNDIALIKVKQSFDKDLQPCCLPATQSGVYPKAKTEAVLSGWGKVLVKPSSRNAPVLQHIVLPIVDHKNVKCRQSIADRRRQICAGYDSLPVDACSGDSGAPLLVVEHENDQGYFVAAGIVSYGNIQCDTSISSGVYTRISFYLDWISTTLATL